jgi:hypothetical protein
MKALSESGNTISLRRLQVINWLLLAVMTAAAWLAGFVHPAQGILVGGLIANISFSFLKRDLVKILAGPGKATKILFFIKYYARLSVLALVIYYLVRYRTVHLGGLLIGLSTVALSIVFTAAAAARNIHSTAKEAA